MHEFASPEPDQIPFAPFPTGVEPKSDVSRQLIIDGLSRPRISTILRRWALSHEAVRRVVLYHTGVRYSVAVVIEEPTFDRIREFNIDLIALLDELFPPAIAPSTYVVGPEFADAPMFRRYGAITVIDKDIDARARSAA